MADQKITDLPHNASPTSDALIEIVSDPGGTPVSESTSIGELPLATAAQGALAETAVQPGDLAAIATTGDYDDLTNRPPRPGAIRFRQGHYSYLSPAAASTIVASLGFCALVPFDMDEPGEMDSITIEVTNAGHTDSLLRLGAYTDDGSHVWGDELLVDGGTVTGASTGFKTVTFAPVSLSVGRYWIAVAFQGTISPSPTLRAAAAGPYAGRTLTGLSFANAVGYATGVTGALPDPIGAPAGGLGCPQVALTGSPLS